LRGFENSWISGECKYYLALKTAGRIFSQGWKKD
jgi:hypothetical protein